MTLKKYFTNGKIVLMLNWAVYDVERDTYFPNMPNKKGRSLFYSLLLFYFNNTGNNMVTVLSQLNSPLKYVPENILGKAKDSSAVIPQREREGYLSSGLTSPLFVQSLGHTTALDPPKAHIMSKCNKSVYVHTWPKL